MTQMQGQSKNTGLSRSHDPAARFVQGETAFFVVLLFAGLHTAVSVMPSGQMLVPYAISFLAAVGILSINVRRVESAVIDWFALLTCFAAALALYTSIRSSGYFAHFRSSAQLVYAVLIGYAAFLGLIVMGRREVERTFFWVVVFLLAGSALEIYGPLRPVSDWFRGIFNAWYGAYSDDTRDALSYGGYRPKLFANEPSILGLTTGFALCIWLGVKKSFTVPEAMLAAFLVGVAFFLIRSPNVLFGPVAFVLVALVSGRNMSAIRRRLGILAIAAFTAVVAIAPAVFIYMTLTMPNAPAYMTKDLSFFERMEAPFLITADTLRSSPLFGIGLGDKDQMNGLALKTLHDMNLGAFELLAKVPNLGNQMGNVFWQYWIVFGIVGGLLFMLIIVDLFKALRIPISGILVLAIAAGTFWQGFGGPNGPLAWFAVFIVAALCKLRERTDATIQNA